MKKILLLLVVSLLTLTGCATEDQPSENQYGGGIEAQDGIVYDFGDIDINGGIVERTFAFKNTDTKPLAIYEATTSCGCTTGIITVGPNTFGPFGMHNQTKETVEIAAGGTFTVTVSYDPLFHGPTDLGLRQRTMFLYSSATADGNIVRTYKDKPNFTEISVTGTVVASVN